MAYEKEVISQLETVELEEILKEERRSAIVLDVRELEECVDHHIPDLPLVPMGEIVNVIDQFDKEKEYIFVCRSGRRSHEVAKFF